MLDLARKKGIKVGIVESDDILHRVPSLLAAGHEMRNMDSGRPSSEVQERLLSANAYIGAFSVAECLAAGAQIVICGRVSE